MGALQRIELNDSLTKCRERYFYKRDTHIYHEGTTGDYFYYIVEGLVAVTTSTAKEDERLLNIATPGQFLGVQGIYDQEYVTNAVTLKNTVVYRFHFEEINELMEGNQELLHLLTDTINHNSEVLLQSLYLATMSAREKLAFFVRIFLQGIGGRTVYATPTQIARYTGLTRMRVYQVLNELENEAVIKTRKGEIEVNDLAFLHE